MEIKRKIITIDDDPEINKLLHRHISNLGYSVTTTENPETFLTACETERPDLCLIDLDIGQKGSGLILVESLRKSYGPSLPIFILSRHNEPEILSFALEVGATDYLYKPPMKERLQELLDRYVPLTNEKLNPDSKLFKVPSHQSQAEISFALEWLGIDERGLWFRSKNLISRGSVFYFQHAEFEKISQKTTPVLLTVSENPIEPNVSPETFKIYGTFDSSDITLVTNVRNWLISRSK